MFTIHEARGLCLVCKHRIQCALTNAQNAIIAWVFMNRPLNPDGVQYSSGCPIIREREYSVKQGTRSERKEVSNEEKELS